MSCIPKNRGNLPEYSRFLECIEPAELKVILRLF